VLVKVKPNRWQGHAQIGNPNTQQTAPSSPLSCKIDYLPKSNHRHKINRFRLTGD
jgi:hypothetical protein